MDEPANLPGFIQKYQPNFPVGSVSQIVAQGYMQLSPMIRTFVPFMAFIDRNGMIQAQYTGGDEFLRDEANMDQKIREEVTKMLSQKPARKAHK